MDFMIGTLWIENCNAASLKLRLINVEMKLGTCAIWSQQRCLAEIL